MGDIRGKSSIIRTGEIEKPNTISMRFLNIDIPYPPQVWVFGQIVTYSWEEGKYVIKLSEHID